MFTYQHPHQNEEQIFRYKKIYTIQCFVYINVLIKKATLSGILVCLFLSECEMVHNINLGIQLATDVLKGRPASKLVGAKFVIGS